MSQPQVVPGSHDVSTAQFDTALRQSVTITGAIGGSLVVYAILVQVLGASLPAPDPVPMLEMLRIALFATAGIVVFTSTILKSFMLRNAPAAADMRLSRLRTAAILTAAFSEVPAIFGLILFLFGRLSGDFYILLVVSLYMLVRHFPRREVWERYVRQGNARAAR